MSIYMDKLPYNCDCCPCNDDCYRCGLSGDLFDEHDIDTGRMKNCKLKRLADVRENVKGHWIIYCDPSMLECSNCRKQFFYYEAETKSNFCPNCGADMRGDKHD